MTQATIEKVIVIGAGQAGFETCNALRNAGFEGQITLVGEENQPPYQRPPLSKAYLLGKMPLERLFFRPPDFYSEQDIALHLSCACTSVNAADQTVTLSDGQILSYDALVLTTGSRPITLPDAIGGALDGVHYVRNLADADRMAKDMQPDRPLLVVGGGYIGLEAAAVAAGLGLKVILVEASGRILQRVACEKTADYFRDLHRSHGVDIHEGIKLERLLGQGGRLVGAELDDGT